MDHEVDSPFAPIVQLDLTTDSGVAILWDILRAPNLFAIHMGLPCGTSSRARERPIAKELREQGVPQPPPLRSALYPLGVPGLNEFHLRKVENANILYALALKILLWAMHRGIIVSVENPASSWLWAALIALLRKHHTAAEAKLYNTLVMILFHACCHGSPRKKHTAWLSSPTVFDALRAECQGDHEHLPFGVSWLQGKWHFDTAAERVYPKLLAQRAAACLVQAATKANLSLQPELRLHDQATAALGRQTKRHPPLIPEFHHFKKLSKNDVLPPNCKVVPPNFRGSDPEEAPMEDTPLSEVNKVGFYHTPRQFLSLALKVQHPMDTTSHLEQVTQDALAFNLKYPADLVKLERKKNLLQARLLSKRLEQEEAKLHEQFTPSLKKVLSDKRLLLWKELLVKYEYDDLPVCDFMFKGVPIVGQHDVPDCYPIQYKMATLTGDDLDRSATWRRKAILGRKPGDINVEHIKHLEETCSEEVELGFLEGPYHSEAEVTQALGRSDWSLIRRFVLVQGAEMKLRPIDDCLESQLNAAYSSTSYLKLQDLDYITGLALRVAEASSQGEQVHGSGAWVGKCLDLSKAYKQLGVLPEHRHYGVIFFHDLDGKPKFYVSNSLMFGATAAVYAFNRVSRSLWFLLNKMLVIPCGVFYDDFPLLSPRETAGDADNAASELLDLLGWRHARTGPKGKPFEPSFTVLGAVLDLSRVREGVVTLSNKEGRVDRLVQQLREVKERGKMTVHESQVLHGLLRFSTGFFAGRQLHQVCAELLQIGGSNNATQLVSFVDYATTILSQCRPRTLQVGREVRPILVFTDGAWENNHSGLGVVLIDTASNYRVVLGGQVPRRLLEHWSALVGEQLIAQIELFAVLWTRWRFRDLLHNRRTIFWIDNESARFGLIKGISPSLTMQCIIREFYTMDVAFPCFSWIERVPSSSNIADPPSRQEPQIACEALGISEWERIDVPDHLVEAVLARRLVM